MPGLGNVWENHKVIKMKKSPLYLLVSGLAVLTASCTKPRIDSRPIVAVTVINTAPVVVVQKNISITIPPGHLFLSAYVIDSQYNISTVSWKQISGPSQIVFSKPDSNYTKLNDLQAGTYSIEFTATDKGGLFDKDTTNLVVSVVPTPSREVILQNQPWDCWFGCAIFLYNSSSLLNGPFLVYIKRDGSNDWTLVPSANQASPADLYSYYADGQYLDIYISWNASPQPDDTPDIKIVY